jgi:predicted ArsR family transcriptional regulator
MEKVVMYAEELAGILGIPVTAIRRHRAKISEHPLLKGLPEPIANRPKLIWLKADIEAWLEDMRTYQRKKRDKNGEQL